MTKGIPKRVFLVVAVCAMIAFFSVLPVARFVSDALAPYLVFGLAAGREGIKVTGGDMRHSLEFSNGVIIHGLKIVPVLAVWAILFAVFTLGLWFLLLRTAGWLIRGRNEALANQVIQFWKFEK
jgi:hypothetical protein